ncbi:DUF5984 family protein [Cellulomonas sp. URHB0016]
MFQFELRPVADVAPWGADETMWHWFALTDGWYWIDVQGRELLRYRDGAVRRWDLARPYPDYYVARFWEDLLQLRAAWREPVPDDLVPFVDGTFPRREFPEASLDDAAEAAVEAAFRLEGNHRMDLGYLTAAPVLTSWRHVVEGMDVVTLRQQATVASREMFEGPARLDVTLPTQELFDAVADVDRRLHAAMEERVTALERTGPPPGIALDVQGLRAEHAQRSRWLAEGLAATRHVDWAQVRAGVATISSWPVVDD